MTTEQPRPEQEPEYIMDAVRSRPHSPLITKELVEELAKREGVKEIVVQPYEWYQISGEKEQWKTGTGPARILVVWD